jgi:hypothetical protein
MCSRRPSRSCSSSRGSSKSRRSARGPAASRFLARGVPRHFPRGDSWTCMAACLGRPLVDPTLRGTRILCKIRYYELVYSMLRWLLSKQTGVAQLFLAAGCHKHTVRAPLLSDRVFPGARSQYSEAMPPTCVTAAHRLQTTAEAPSHAQSLARAGEVLTQLRACGGMCKRR